MGTLTQALIKSEPTALHFVKTLLDTPTLINPGFSVYKGQSSLPFAIPLETVSHKQTLQVEVAESLVITKDSKVNAADNVAPGTWQWQLSGYIPGIPALEPTNKYTPFVTLNTKLLKLAAEKGYILKFKDVDASLYSNVVIKSLDIETQKDCRNRTPFSMTLKEISVLDNLVSDLTTAESAATAETGSSIGNALKFGTTIALTSALDLVSELM